MCTKELLKCPSKNKKNNILFFAITVDILITDNAKCSMQTPSQKAFCTPTPAPPPPHPLQQLVKYMSTVISLWFHFKVAQCGIY